MDSGCSKDIISEDTVHALDTGDKLKIVGTGNLFMKTQVTGPTRRVIEAAVLRGNETERELLVSLKNMEKYSIVHLTFPFETVEQYLMINENYSTAYKIANLAYSTPSKRDIKKPSKEHRKLKDKIMEKYTNIFVEKLGKKDRLNCSPLSLNTI